MSDELLKAKLDGLDEKLDRALYLLEGNGDPSKGLVVRVDRLEQRGKLVWSGLGISATALITAFWSKITGK